MMAGTRKYLAPEVFDNFYDTKADIWSLGVCLTYLLSGKNPFIGPGEDVD